MRPEEFAERMRALPTGDPETDHDEGDQLMAEALRSIGLSRGRRRVGKLDEVVRMRTARQDHALTHPLLTAEALDQSFHRRRQEHGLLLSTILMVTVFDGRPVWKATAAALDRKRQRMSLLEELTPAARLVVENTTWEMLEGVGEPPDSVVVQIDGVILYRRRKLTRLEADALPASFWMAAGSPTRL